MRNGLERIARAAAARPVVVLLAVVALACGGGALALGLQPSADTDTLASRSSDAGGATAAFHRDFGDDAILVLIRERVADLVLTADLGRTIQLEGCLGGNVPADARPYGGDSSPCAELAKLKPARVVYGPGTFLNEATRSVADAFMQELTSAQERSRAASAAAIRAAKRQGKSAAEQQRAGEAASRVAAQQASAALLRLAVDTGIKGLPQIDNRAFISQIVFDPARGADVPKSRFAYLFPSADSALIQVRLRDDLTPQERRRAISLVREAVAMRMFRSARGGTYTVSGVPVVVEDLADSLTSEIALLLVAAVAAMALVLLLVFRARLRLLPLAIALAATGLTFGAMRLAGVELTMASIAVLPVLIGLAVDYAIQFQSRVEEEREAGAEGAEAVGRAARAGAPTIATAGLATATGFLVLLFSPVPMVRGFGVLLVVGIALAFACALTAGSAALALGTRGRGGAGAGGPGGADASGERGRAAGRVARALAAAAAVPARALRSSAAGARDILASAGRAIVSVAPLRALGRGAARVASPRAVLGASLRRPGRILAVAFTLAAVGWAVETQTDVVSDVTKLVPADMPALADLTTLQDATRSSGEIDVVVRGDDVARPEVVAWMTDYQARVLRRLGYDARDGCADARICPAFSLPDLFSGTRTDSKEAIDGLLDAVPPYFASAVLTSDRDAATLAFGIRLMPLDEQQQVVDILRDELNPPKGVRAELAGLPVVTAQANAELSSAGRRLLLLLTGLVAVAAVLFAVYRRADRAFVPLVPIALATGWSALVLFLTRVPLNPMSATLGALVIAISTEFSVLLSERFRQERADGHDVATALARTYRSTGRAVLASGVTAIAGFGVLALSDIRMLRDFGIVTVVDLVVSLIGVLVVLPSVLVLAERGVFARLAQRLPLRRRGRRAPRPDVPAA
ncbi:MMPL family transporter [Conexibacter woesei]|uniref:RND superfamily protein-like exporter n=1 Tax=Conexibacter woesei (strain DSM 14684 / CCUG 47730 / CIP 108061 / JCM 11494 / NBRC 100937 / ID131577) TaxID=469383 RepID=D3F0Y0_CONWI|nr:MMPL family transporter [Conexibacter woesei]ADB50056.1 RND superfamily protein-like exporter [Conexibacter woesei DSM 14684]